MEEKLTEVLLTKNWGEKEKELVMRSFKILQGKNQKQILKEFIDCITDLNNFTIEYDINKSDYYKSKLVRLSQKELLKKDDISDIGKNRHLFRKENEHYIPDKEGDYLLEVLGWYGNNNISIFKENTSTFFHELAHAAQKGFKISSNYAGSGTLIYILSEGDAMSYELNVLNDFMHREIMLNNISYAQEYHFFKNMEFLLGKNFIEEWKKNQKKNYMKEAFSYFEQSFGKDFLEEIIACFLILENSEKISINNVALLKERCEKTIDSFNKKIVSLKDYDKEVLELEKEIECSEKILNDPLQFKEKVMKERKGYLEDKKNYENLLIGIINCKKDPQKIKEYLEIIKEDYNEEINYEEVAKNIIAEYNTVLNGNYLEEKIKEDITNELAFLKSKLSKKLNLAQINKDRELNIREEMEAYLKSLTIYTKVINLLQYRNTLSEEEKKYFSEWLLLIIQILFHNCNTIKIMKSNTNADVADYYGILESSLILAPKIEEDTSFMKDFTQLNQHLFALQMNIINHLYKSNKLNDMLYIKYSNTASFKMEMRALHIKGLTR